MRVGRTTFLLSLSKLIAYLIGFVATIYYARIVGEEILGFYFLTLAIVSWLGVGARVGFSKALSKRLSEGNEPGAFFTAGALIIFVFFTILTGILYLFQNSLESYVGEPVFGFVILLLAGTLLFNFSGAAIQGSRLVHLYAGFELLKRITRNAFQILLIFIGFELSGLLFGYATGWLVAGVLALLFIDIKPARPNWSHFQSLFDYAKYAWLGSIRGRSFRWIDITVLGVFVTSGVVGVYSVAWTIAAFLQFFSNAIITTVFPEISHQSEQEDKSAVKNLVNVSVSYSGLILVPGLVGGLVIGDRILQLYGDAFVEGTEVFAILLAGVLIYSYQKQFIAGLGAIDRPDLAFKSNALFIVINIVLNIVLIWRFGWVGAAVATAVSAVIGLVHSYIYINRLVTVSIPYREVFEQWVSAIVMGILIIIVRWTTEETILATYNEVFVLFLVGTGATVYFISLFVVSNSFRNIIIQNAPSNIKKLILSGTK